MKVQIVEKLDKFLTEHQMKEECEVVYLLVELRKQPRILPSFDVR